MGADSSPLPHICLLQQRIHLSSSCWGLINGSGSCDPVINSFAHNCSKTKPWIRSFSPSPLPWGLNSQKILEFSSNFLPFLVFLFAHPFNTQDKNSVGIDVRGYPSRRQGPETFTSTTDAEQILAQGNGLGFALGILQELCSLLMGGAWCPAGFGGLKGRNSKDGPSSFLIF